MSISSEITRINTNIANAYTAASGKGATLPATQNSNNLASTINTISTGISINGIIEEYEVASGGNVSAGDFVKFIAYRYGSDNMYLYGVVITISGTTITSGTITEISSSTQYVGCDISAVKLDNNKVFIAYTYGGTDTAYLYGIVCTISRHYYNNRS